MKWYGANPSSPTSVAWPEPRGWVKSEIGWVPSWISLPRAAKVMNVLNSCGCTTSCTGRCSCYNKGIVCTARCRCSGHCYGRSNPSPTPSSNWQHCCHVACTTQHHNLLHVIVIHHYDYRSSPSYQCGYLFHQSSCIYVDAGDSWYCLALFLMWPSIKLLIKSCLYKFNVWWCWWVIKKYYNLWHHQMFLEMY